MKKLMFAAIAAVCSATLFSATNDNLVAKALAKPSAEEQAAAKAARREEFLKETGGFVVKEDKGNGLVLIANAQKRLNRDKISRPVRYMLVYAKLPVVMRDVDPALAANPGPTSAADQKATVVLFVKDDPNCTSTIVVSPDERWGFVNVAALDADKPGDEVLESRVSKATNRALCLLLGAGGSKYPNTMVGSFRNGIKDYERFPTDGLPPDVFPRMAEYAKNIGIRPVVRTTYINACERGWAPAPTNDYQRAIWKQVHDMPQQPRKIKFDKNRDAGK